MGNRKREISTTFIKNIVSSMGVNTNNFVLVKHYGNYSIDLEDAKKAMMEYPDIQSIIHILQIMKWWEALSRF